MTLIQIVNYVCAQMGLYDQVSLNLARGFANAQYIMLWDKYDWIDSQTFTTVGLSTGTRTFFMPEGFSRIVTLMATTTSTVPSLPDLPSFASDGHFLDPVNDTFLIENDPTMLNKGGMPLYYQELAPDVNGETQVRIYPTPIMDQSLYIYGKTECPGLVADTDETLIRNIDKTLIAYVMADMLQRQRQYAKAQLKFQEALQLEQAVQELEKKQANQPRKSKAISVTGDSLIEMVDAVSALSGQWEPRSRVLIRDFVRRNYQGLYDVFLWPESLVMVSVAYQCEQVVMPYYIDKILGIREDTSNFRLSPMDATLLLDVNPMIFDQTGTPVAFTYLTPVGVAVLPGLLTQLQLASTSPIDVGNVFIRGEVLSTGVELTEEITLQGTTPVNTVNYYDIPITVAKDIGFGDVTIVALQSPGGSGSLGVIPANRRERKYQRILLSMPPNASGTLLVLAKRAIVPLEKDEDATIITGCQQVVIAGAAADFFTAVGQLDRATAMRTKADAAAKVLIQKNEDQQAKEPRFTPYVEPYSYIPSDALIWVK